MQNISRLSAPLSQSTGLSMLVCLLFIVSPLLGILICATLALGQQSNSLRTVSLLALLGAAYLGLINTTKLPDSDLLAYLKLYDHARGLNLFEFLDLFVREPLYYTWMYLISTITDNDAAAFVFLSTFVTYLIVLFSIIWISRCLALSNWVTVLIMLSFLLFGPLFSISAHLLRQFFAAALVTVFYTKRIATERYSWWILVAAIFLHYSAVLFFLFAVWKFPRRHSSALYVIFSIGLLGLVAYGARLVADFLAGAPFIGLIFARIAADHGHDIGRLSTSALLFIWLIAGLAVLNFRTYRLSGNSGVQNFNLTLILLAAVVLFANTNAGTAEISKRYYFYLYFLAALAVPMAVASRQWIQNALPVLPLIMGIHFLVNLETGSWEYASMQRILFEPSWVLWGR